MNVTCVDLGHVVLNNTKQTVFIYIIVFHTLSPHSVS